MWQSLLAVGVGAVVVLAAGCAHSGGGGAAQKVAKEDVPAKVSAAVNSRFPGADVRGVEKETEGGAVVYDFELTQGGRKYEADVKEDGTILEVEKEVPGGDVPAAVSAAVRARYPGASVKEVMEVNKVAGGRETPDHYEVTLSTGGKREKEVVVSLDGKTVTEEAAEEGNK